MNILIIPSWYPSPENEYAGIFIKEQALLFATQFPEHNIGISTWGSNHRSLLLSLDSLFRIPFKLLNKPKKYNLDLLPNCTEYFTPHWTWTRKLFKGNIKSIIAGNSENLRDFQLKYGKVNLIHAHASHPGGYIAMSLSQTYKIPFMITEHMTPFPFGSYVNKGRISNYILEPLSKASIFICVSNFLKKSVENHTANKIIVLNNFVDENFFYPTNEVEISKEKISLLFIGRLVHQKGVDILLEALQILTKSPLNYELTIGGSGENEIDYRSLASRLGIQNRIKWLGDLNRTQVREEIQKCTLLVLPSRHENNPVILLETISCGKPIVATKCGGSEEIVSQTNGMTSKSENSSDLAEKIASIASSIKNYSASLIRNEFMNNYSSKVGTQKLLSIYKDLIKEGS